MLDYATYGYECYTRIGLILVTTNANGVANFRAEYPYTTETGKGQAIPGDHIVSFARSATENTSEFSPAALVTATADSVCTYTDATRTYSINAVPGATSYIWSTTGGTITSGQGTNAITVDWTGVSMGNYNVQLKAVNDCGETVTESTPVVIYQCATDLFISKTDSPNPVQAGGILTYTITVTNTAPGAINAYNVVVNDTLPAGLTLNNASPTAGTWNSHKWSIDTLTAGATAILTLTATLNSGYSLPTIINIASVISTTPDLVPGNNSDTAITFVGISADLAVTKTFTNPADLVVPGSMVYFTTTVRNLGPSNALNVKINDINSSLTNKEFSLDGNTWTDIESAPFTVPVLMSDTIITGYLRGMLLSNFTGTFSNIVTVTSDTPDGILSNNADTVSKTVSPIADLKIVKICNTPPANIIAGNEVQYTLTVSNLGPSDAADATFTDDMITAGSFTGTPVYSADNGSNWLTWTGSYTTLTSLSDGLSISILLKGTLAGDFTGTLTNTASVSSTTTDTIPSNNTSTIFSAVGVEADLSIVKTGPASVTSGGIASYTLNITNNGSSQAQNIFISDVFDHLYFSNTTYSDGTNSGSWSGSINYSTLNASENKTISISATVNQNLISSTTIKNLATTFSSIYDPLLANNSDSIFSTVLTSADLTISKVLNTPDSMVIAGQTVEYTITAHNNGPSQASGYTVHDQFSSGTIPLQYLPHGNSSWLNWPSNNQVGFGNLSSGGTSTIKVRATVNIDNNGTISNSATIRSLTPDPVPGDSTFTTTPVQVNDQTPPTISCPDPVTVSCTGDIPAADVASVITSDNFGGIITVTQVGIDSKINQTCDNQYNLERTYRATDSSGNYSECTQTITVYDTIAPIVTCPTPVTVACTQDIPVDITNYTEFVNQGGTATDNCAGSLIITQVSNTVSNQQCQNKFTITRVYRVSDDCGNSFTCDQIITVNDTIPPIFTTPADTTISCSGSKDPDDLGLPLIAISNCGGTNQTSSYTDAWEAPVGCNGTGTILRTWTVTDQCGNSASSVQRITIVDVSDPTITCASPEISYNTDLGDCSYTVQGTALDPVTTNDNCGISTVTNDFNHLSSLQGAIFPVGTTTVIWTVTDNCGRTATCSYDVIVVDNEKPIANCKNISVNLIATGNATITAVDINNNSIDNCGIFSLTASQTSFGCSDAGANTVTLTVTDIHGNSSTCDATVTVNDLNAPTLSINDVTVDESAATANYTVTLSNPSDCDVIFTVNTTNATAISGSDYTPITATTDTIFGGSTTTTISIPILDDQIAEPVETYYVNLSNTIHAVLADNQGLGTITDNDSASVSINDVTVNENAGTATFVVSLSGNTQSSISVDYATADSTALDEIDYTGKTGTGTFPAGSVNGAFQTITINITNDLISEPTEEFKVTLSNISSAGNASISDNLGIGTINDNDLVTLSLSGFTTTETDGTQTNNFTVTLNTKAQNDIIINFSTTNNTATASSDYVAQIATSYTIPAGNISFTIPVDVLGDLVTEPTENFTGTITINNANGQNVSISTATDTSTIYDNDAVNVAIDDVTVNEGDGTATFTVTLSGNIQDSLTVNYSTANGTAKLLTDYTSTTGTITFPIGSLSGATQSIVVPIINDNLSEPTEVFYVNLSSIGFTGIANINDAQGIGTIIDDDPITLTLNGFTTTETNGSQSQDFEVELNVAAQYDIVINFSLANGSATAGSDFNIQTNVSFTIPAGDTIVQIPVVVLGDLISEPTETFTGTISITNTNGQQVTLGTSSATTTINDDDDASVAINNVNVNEADGTANFVVTLTGTIQNALTVDYSTTTGTAGTSDFTTMSGTVTFPAGSISGSTQPINIPNTNDLITEPQESFTVGLTNLVSTGIATITNATGIATIDDNDDSSLEINDVTVTESDGTATFLVALTGTIQDALTVDYTTTTGTAGASDFTSISGTVTFLAGSLNGSTQPIHVTILNDLITEPEESFTVELSNVVCTGDATITTAIGTGTINDDDITSLAINDVTISEAGGTATFLVTLTGTIQDALTFNFATISGSAGTTDFVPVSGTVTFPAGSVTGASHPINVTILNDFKAEPQESFTVSLSNLVSSINITFTTFIGTCTINDNDAASVAINDVTVNETDLTATFEVTLTGSIQDALTVDFSTFIGTADASDFNATSGSVTFSAGSVTGATQPINVTILNDLIAEPQESFTVVLSNLVSTGNVSISTNSGSGTINDDDAYTINFDGFDVTENDGTQTENFIATMNGIAEKDVILTFFTTNGTAGSVDFTAVTGYSATILAGTNSVSIPVDILGDLISEPKEVFTGTINLSSSNGQQISILKNTATATIFDDEIIVLNDFVTISEDGTLNGTSLLVNAIDPLGNTLTINTTPVSGPDYGTLVINPDGTYTYTPDLNYNGSDSFTYEVCDDGTPSKCATATVNVTITAVNDAPTLSNSAITINEDEILNGVSLLAAATDVEGNTLSINTTPLSEPDHGSLVINADGTYTYTPDPNYNGGDSFTYEVCDDGTPSECSTATVTITITAVNDAPKAVADVASISEDGTLNGTSLLANDSDPEGNTMTITTTPVSGPDFGSLTINSDGTYTYTPDPNYNGSDSFTYEVCDDGTPSECSTAIVNITISAVNDAPTLSNSTITINEDETLNGINLLTGVTDLEGNAFTITTTPVSGPSHGTLVINPDGTYTYTPDPNYNGSDLFTYQVCDNGTPSECSTATVSITITSVNDAPKAVADVATISEDGTMNGTSLLSNDSDPEGNALTITTTPVSGPDFGTLLINSDGTYTYTPDPNYNGSDSFTYEVCDDGTPSECSTAVVNITITAVNDAPILSNSSVTINEDEILNGNNLLTGATDPEGNTLTINTTPVSGPTVGTLVINADGTYTYTPDPNHYGDDSFTYQVCDNGTPSQCSTATVNITITSVNDAPKAVADVATISEDGTLNGTNLLSNDSDPEGDALTITTTPVSGPDHGIVVIHADGTYSYKPDANYNGSDSFTYEVCDNGIPSECSTALVNITINAVNDAPSAVNDVATISEDGTLNGSSLLSNDTDTEGNALTINTTPVSGPDFGILVINTNGTFTYTPDPNYNGSDLFTYQVCDNGTPSLCSNATVTITIDAVNDAPIASIDIATISEDGILNGSNLLANDTDPEGNTLTIIITPITTTTHGTLVIHADGTYTYTPDPNYYGSDTFIYQVCDNGTPSQCSNSTVTITVTSVNDAPIALNDNSGTDLNTPVTTKVLDNDYDIDGTLSASSVSIINYPLNGSVVVNSLTGEITYTPDTDFYGYDNYDYQVCDNNGACAQATVFIQVPTIAPVAVNDIASTNEDSSVNIDVVANDYDPQGDFDYGSVIIVSGPSHGCIFINPSTSVVTYTPFANYFGDDLFIYQICDLTSFCSQALVNLTVINVNDAPYAMNDNVTISEDGTLNGTSLLDNDTDPEGNNLTINTTPVSGPDFGTLIIHANGTYTYTPDPNYNGNDSFIYEVCDNGTPSLCATATVNITITAVNDAPIAVNDVATISESGILNGTNLLANDTDSEGNTLTINTIPVSEPTNGALSINPDGTYTYIPNPNYKGNDSFTYQVCDNGTPSQCSNAIVSISVTAINHSPIAINDVASIGEDGILNGINLLANDSDPDGNILKINTTQQSGPNHGTLVIYPNGTYRYTPDKNYNGSDAFSYQICDNGTPSLCSTASVQITITAVNDAPVAADDVVTIDEDGVLNGNNLLDNDYDIEGNAITINIIPVNTPTHGSLIINSDGTYIYTPDPDYFGNDSFRYQVCDNGAPSLCSTAKVNITITSVNDAPIAVNDSVIINEDETLNGVTLLINDTDPDGNLLIITTNPFKEPNNGTLTINSDGTYTYKPDPNFFGNDSFIYQICDNGIPSRCATSTVVISIQSVNDAPDAKTDETVILVNTTTPTIVDVQINDIDIEGDKLKTTIITGPTSGGTAIVINGDSIRYTPPTNFIGTDIIIYQICDNGVPSLCDIDTVFIHVIDHLVAIDDKFDVNAGQSDNLDIITNDWHVRNISPSVIVNPIHGTAILNPDGFIVFTADSNFVGNDTITYVISDGINTDTASVVITIHPVVELITGTSCNGELAQLNWNVNVIGTQVSAINIKIYDRDGILLQSITDTTLVGSYRWPGLSLDGFGNIIQPPANLQTLKLEAQYQVSPFNEAAISIISYHDCHINKVVAVSDTATITQHVQVIRVLDNDYDPDEGDIDKTTLAIVKYTDFAGPYHGTVTVKNDGTIVYYPVLKFSGLDSFVYVICDNVHPETACDTAIVRLNVIWIEKLIANDDHFLIYKGETKTFDIMLNDYDPSETFNLTSLKLLDNPHHGSFTFENDGKITYKPNDGFIGRDSFYYEICNKWLPPECDQAWIYVDVIENQQLVAIPDNITTKVEKNINIPVLINDYDPEEMIDTTSLNIIVSPVHGKVNILPMAQLIIYLIMVLQGLIHLFTGCVIVGSPQPAILQLLELMLLTTILL